MIVFEQSILSLLPSCVFQLAVAARVLQVWRRKSRSQSRPHTASKFGLVTTHFCVQVAFLSVWSLPSTWKARTSLPLAIIGMLEAAATATISAFEHFKSTTRSLLLNGFLLLSLVLGVPVARIYWLRPGFEVIAAPYTVLLAIKALLLVVEELPKRYSITDDDPGVESNSGILSRGAFWWLNPLLLKGARSILSVDTISSIGPKFSSRKLKNRLKHYWDLDSRKHQYALLKCTFLAYKLQFLAGVPARICSSGFNFAQPFLIHSLVDFVGKSSDERSKSTATGLMIARLLVCLGLAPLVFDKMLRLKSSRIENAAPVTLMSTDIEGIMLSGNAVHDAWASLYELPVGLYILHRYAGNTSLLVLVPAVGQDLTFAEAFTIVTVIDLEIRPLNHMFALPSQIFSVIGCFSRLQDFLLLEEDDTTAPHRPSRYQPTKATDDHGPGLPLEQTDLTDNRSVSTTPAHGPRSSIAVSLEHASFSNSDGVATSDNCNILFERGSVSMVVGPTGSGKSSLLRAIAGDMMITSGQIHVTGGAIALCEQVLWLQNLSIRDYVVGKSVVDDAWLDVVLQACALNSDIAALPQRELAMIGSAGVALSGGQKKRVALARAIYSRCPLLLLDDILSGLDRTTTDEVLEGLLGRSGLLRCTGITVIMTTSSVTPDAIDSTTQNAVQRDATRKATPRTAMNENVLQLCSVQSNVPDNTAADPQRQSGAFEYYKIYLRSVGKLGVVALFFLTSMHTAFTKLPQIWLLFWTRVGTYHHDAAYHVAVYIALAVASSATFTFALLYFLLVTVPRSGKNLHGLLVTSVLRFSQDMTLVDNALPMTMLMAIFFALRAIAELIIVASGASFAGLAILPGLLVLYLVQKYYLRTSRQMRLLDLELKSPLYTMFKETLAGLATVRAFGWDTAFMQDCDPRLDESQKPFYMMFCIQRWLQVMLDLFTAGIAFVLVAVAVIVSDATSKVAIGLALVNLIGLSLTLVLVIDQWTRLETTLGAIARLNTFVKETPDEILMGEPRCARLPNDWPSRGELELENVTASYGGKSSIILAVAQMLQLSSGHIRLDGLDLSTVPLQDLRSRLTIVPQDPLVFPGSVRDNLVPSTAHAPPSNDRIIEVLHKTLLWPAIAVRGGLDAAMDDAFSTGQLQLLALARALLTASPIIVLDEATSSVDKATDEQVRVLIRDELEDRTVLEIAHKLEIIEAYDLVVVVDKGEVVEVGNPGELLLRDVPSAFMELWRS
ncbi:ABC transporter like protein [Zymoseptoria brevis]|uniref:ABC transporter like protein n=1 Tax=Zymoseptoria brevis TaxID=1047168 RepID=A0A0F4GMG4_9PEZI|nr:ABC transporter like protein [Zymoseptoria brevis]